MCDMGISAMVAIAAASAAMQIQAQSDQKQTTKEMQKRQMAENARVMAANRKYAHRGIHQPGEARELREAARTRSPCRQAR